MSTTEPFTPRTQYLSTCATNVEICQAYARATRVVFDEKFPTALEPAALEWIKHQRTYFYGDVVKTARKMGVNCVVVGNVDTQITEGNSSVLWNKALLLEANLLDKLLESTQR